MSSDPPSMLPGGQPTGLTNANMLFYIDMGLIAVLGLVTLIYLPRTIARYSTKSTLREGWMLLRGNSRYPPSRLSTVLKNKQLETPNASTIQYPPHLQTDTPPAASTMSHIYGVSTINDGFLASKERLGSGSPPPHVRGYLSRFPIVARVLEYHILGYRVGQLIVSTTYLALMCFAMFYQSDPGSNVMRAGFVAMSQMPIVFALGTKNSVVTALTGISYEQACILEIRTYLRG
ncbi:hypothetical protein FRC12_005314 [Ceratobasidium sp. 428]|nr:hypothetical protein FRC12_005314 [Ceratobasidium sp. 428]